MLESMWMSLLSLFDVCCIILQNNFGAKGLTLKPLHANGSSSRGGGGGGGKKVSFTAYSSCRLQLLQV